MADRYWVGGSGNWSDTAHWSTTDGGASGASVPTSSDNANFTNLSSAANAAYTVTLDATGGDKNCLDFNMAGPGGGNKVTWAGSQPLVISGNMNLSGGTAGITRSYTGTLTFNATATGKTITSGGITFVSPTTVLFDGVGGGWTLQDAFSNGGAGTTITNGTLDTNGKNFTSGSISHASGTFSLTLGASAVALSGATGISFTASGLTLSAASSTITLSSATSAITNGTGGSLTFGAVVFTGAGGSKPVTGSNTFGSISYTGNAAVGNFLQFAAGTTQTITTLTLASNSPSNRVGVRSSTAGTSVSLVVGAATLTDIDFIDIAVTGGAAPLTGTRLGNATGNSGITFTGAANKYWVGNTANWDSTSWALTSGGAAGVNNYPLPQDTAVFDANSFSANSQVVTINAAHRLPALNFSAITKTGITLANGTNAPTLYGSVTLESHMVITGTSAITYSGRNTQVITSAGVAWVQPLTITSIGGTVQFGDDFSNGATSTCTLNNGTIDLNGKTLSVATFGSSNTNARTIMSSVAGGKFVTTRAAAVTAWNMATSTNATIDRATASWTIEIGGNTTSTRTFSGGGLTYPALTFTNTTANGELDFVGNNTFKSLSYNGGTAQTIKFTAGSTTALEDNNGFFSGTSGNVITIDSITAASHTLSKSSGSVDVSYLTIGHSTATGGATWTALTTNGNTDSGNNSGWDFSGGTNATLTGQSITSSLGSFSLQVDSTASLTGLSISSSLGTLTPEVDDSDPLVGFSITASLGILIAESDTSVSLSGFSSTGSLGILAARIDDSEPIIGFAVSALLGALDILIDNSEPLVGFSASTALGLLSARSDVSPVLSGFSTSSSLGAFDLQVDALPELTGFSAAASLGTLGASIDVVLVGFSTSGSLGIFVIDQDNNSFPLSSLTSETFLGSLETEGRSGRAEVSVTIRKSSASTEIRQ